MEGGRRTSGNEISDLNWINQLRVSPASFWASGPLAVRVQGAGIGISGPRQRRKALEAQLSAKLEGMRDQTGT